MGRETMRVLVLTKTLPFPPRNGLELPVAKIFEEIAVHHEVDILVISNDQADFELRKELLPGHFGRAYFLRPGKMGRVRRLKNEVMGIKPAFFSHQFEAKDLRALAEHFDYDFVWVSPPGNYTFIEACRKHGIGRFKRLVLGLNDLITSIYSKHISEIIHRRIFDWRFLSFGLRSMFIARLERKYLYDFDLVHLQTEKEEAKALELLKDRTFADRIISAPNGIKEFLFDCQYGKTESKAILYMTHLDGDRSGEAKWFIKKVWPQVRQRTDAELWLVGTPPARPIPLIDDDDRIKVLGFVPDLMKTYEAVRICIVPIFHNCGLINRIQDTLAAGVPAVATAISADTFPNLRPGYHLLTAAQPQEFADQTIKLYNDPGLRSQLSKAGRQYAKALPNWLETATKIRIRMEQLHGSMNGHHASSAKWVVDDVESIKLG